LASLRKNSADQIKKLEEQLAQGDPHAQNRFGLELLRRADAQPGTREEGLSLLEAAASQGDPQLQHELGGIFLYGRHGVDADLQLGRSWWAKALEQNHIRTIEYVAPAYQNGQFGYPIDLLKSKTLQNELERARRYSEASPIERQVMDIEERYRLEYQRAVNSLDRRDGSPAGQARIRTEIDRLRQKYKGLREEEIARLNP